MTWFAIVLLAASMAMDATAVAIGIGLTLHEVRWHHALRVGACFGGFQLAMPLIGNATSERIGPWIAPWDTWLACALLIGIGGKMLHDALRKDANDDAPRPDPLHLPALLGMGVATSIDALAVGFTFPTLHAPPVTASIAIGVITAALSAAGLHAGKRLGNAFGHRLDAVAGLVLIALGIKALAGYLIV